MNETASNETLPTTTQTAQPPAPLGSGEIVPKVLVVDRDRASSQTILDALKKGNVESIAELGKDNAIQMVGEQGYNIVYVDPTPQPDVRPFIIALRRMSGRNKKYVYVIVGTRDKTRNDILNIGGNNHFSKPISPSEIAPCIENATRFLNFVAKVQSFEEDDTVVSQGGLMGRACLSQVLYSAVDRADRYGERAYVMDIKFDNIDVLKNQLGEEGYAAYMTNFTKELRKIRRHSDLIGRFDPHHFVLIMQRPVNDREPVDATARMAMNITQILQSDAFKSNPAKITLSTMSIPVGEIIADHIATNM